MKITILLFAFLTTSISFAQDKKDIKLNKTTNLIDVVFYHNNGTVSQTGTYTLDGKLHGEWLQFNSEGKKLVLANYDNGRKVGKWFYWTNKTLKEIDYTSNNIANVTEWTNDKTKIAVRN